jgi:hypothetical protein
MIMVANKAKFMLSYIRWVCFCEEDMGIESYLTGYADGEGCFCVTFNKSKRHKLGWEIRPSFSVSQNNDRSEVISIFKKYFGCGSIRRDRSDKTVKFETRSVKDLVEKVIPHFKKCPLISGKRKDFEIFSDICEKIYKQEHLACQGFNQIVELSSRINISGKKRIPRKTIKI